MRRRYMANTSQIKRVGTLLMRCLNAQALGDDEAALAVKLQTADALEAEAGSLPCNVQRDVEKLQVPPPPLPSQPSLQRWLRDILWCMSAVRSIMWFQELKSMYSVDRL